MTRKARLVASTVGLALLAVAAITTFSQNTAVASSGPWVFYGTGDNTWTGENWKFAASWVYRHHTVDDLEMQKSTIKSTNLASYYRTGPGSFKIEYGNQPQLDFWNFSWDYNAGQTIWTDYVRNKFYDKWPWGGVRCTCQSGTSWPPYNTWAITAYGGETSISKWHNN